MKKLILIMLMLPTTWARCEDGDLPLANPGFEEELEGWTVTGAKDPENVRVTAEASRGGTKGLQVKDTDASSSYRITSSPVAVVAGAIYQVTFVADSNGGGTGIGVSMSFRDANNVEIPPVKVPKAWPTCLIKDTDRFTIRAQAPPGASSLRVVITSYSSPGGEAILDDFAISQAEAGEESVP